MFSVRYSNDTLHTSNIAPKHLPYLSTGSLQIVALADVTRQVGLATSWRECSGHAKQDALLACMPQT